MRLAFFVLVALALWQHLACAARSPMMLRDHSRSLQTQTPPSNIALLKDIRDQITFPSYTPEQRLLVAQQAQLMMDVFVNRESKMTFYGEDVDPVPKIAKIVQEAEKMTDEAFHVSMVSLFASLRDLHTNYILPQPYSCFTSFLPLTIKEVYSPSTERVAVIDSIRATAVSLVPEISQLRVGDLVLSYDGKTIDELGKTLPGSLGAGSNNFAGFRRVLGRLTLRGQTQTLVPTMDSVTLNLQRPNKTTYSVKLPWLVTIRPTCRQSARVLPTKDLLSSLSLYKDQSVLSVDLLQLEFTSFFGVDAERQEATGAFPPLTNSNDATVRYGVIENKSGKFGYIVYSSFVPANSTNQPSDIFRIFQGLLSDTFNETDGLILDVRSNGGGLATIADGLPQLFGPGPVKPASFRALNKDLNGRIFRATNQSTWIKAYENTKPGSTYTATGSFSTFEEVNLLGRAYFGPVAILTNAECYSACDIFTGTMQDVGFATIWNEDLLTGAGGANVVDTAYFVNSTLPEFKPLPGGQSMRVGYRQVIRQGKYEGFLIEDRGVQADRRARPTREDILGVTSSQLDAITADLRAQKVDFQAYFAILDRRPRIPVNILEKGPTSNLNVTLKAVARAISKVTYSIDGVASGESTITSFSLQKRPLDLSFILQRSLVKPRLVTIGIQAYSSGSKLELSTTRLLKLIPMSFVPFGVWNFDLSSGVAVYTEGEERNGWTLQNETGQRKLVVGDGKQYVDNVSSSVSFFLDLRGKTSATATIEFAMIQTEKDFDFVTIVGRSSRGEVLYVRETGKAGAKKVELDLSAHLDTTMELEIAFTSDGGVTDIGATITKVAFLATP